MATKNDEEVIRPATESEVEELVNWAAEASKKLADLPVEVARELRVFAERLVDDIAAEIAKSDVQTSPEQRALNLGFAIIGQLQGYRYVAVALAETGIVKCDREGCGEHFVDALEFLRHNSTRHLHDSGGVAVSSVKSGKS